MKLRRHVGQPSFGRAGQVIYEPGIWYTQDGRWMLVRPFKPLFSSRGQDRRCAHWCIAAAQTEDYSLLQQMGLHDQRFETRRDAVAALKTSLDLLASG